MVNGVFQEYRNAKVLLRKKLVSQAEITNILVCFNVYEMRGLLIDKDEKPCNTNTAYASVVIHATAQLVENIEEKELALSSIVQKYTPHLIDKEIPLNMLRGTAVIRLSISEMTGKYYC